MKKFALVIALLVPLAGFSQKEVKPSVQKAEKALKEGKLDEAKAIIDATTSSQEFMVDKKGNPSKNAAKAWWFKGAIYAAIDTTSNETYKGLEANAFPIAKEAFDKAKQIDPKASSFYKDQFGMDVPVDIANQYFAQAYFNKAINAYNENDYKTAFAMSENTLYFIPNDTSVLLNAGVYFGPAANEDDKSLALMREYINKGGKSPDPYIMSFGILRDKKKDLEGALKIAQEAIAKFPGNSEFPKYELDIFIKTNRLPEAKAAMEKQVSADPSDKESRYFLGVINMELKDYVEARKWFEEAIKIDPKYFDPNLAIAEIVFLDAKEVKQQMNQLGISKEDMKKKIELDKVYVEKLKVALPYFEKCEKLAPDDAKVLDNLFSIYTDLGNDAQVARVSKRMKTLGLLDE